MQILGLSESREASSCYGKGDVWALSETGRFLDGDNVVFCRQAMCIFSPHPLLVGFVRKFLVEIPRLYFFFVSHTSKQVTSSGRSRECASVFLIFFLEMEIQRFRCLFVFSLHTRKYLYTDLSRTLQRLSFEGV